MTTSGDSERSPGFGEDLPDVDPLTAPVGSQFVIQQHHATALHHDFRLEMMNQIGPVLVSWAVPKGLPRSRGQRHLAIRTPDHSMDHADFSGSIPDDEYGGGEVRIFDHGSFEMVARTGDRITFRLEGERLVGIWHLVSTGEDKGKEQWLALMREDQRPPGEQQPSLEPMVATSGTEPFQDPGWGFEPEWSGNRVFAVCAEDTRLISKNGEDLSPRHPELKNLHRHVIALEAILDGVLVADSSGEGTYVAFDVIYFDGKDLTGAPLTERRRLLEEAIVPNPYLQLSPMSEGNGTDLHQAAIKQGLAGIVAKRLTSTYRPGEESSDWVVISS